MELKNNNNNIANITIPSNTDNLNDDILSKTKMYIRKNFRFKTFGRLINMALIITILYYAHHTAKVESMVPIMKDIAVNIQNALNITSDE